MDRQDHDREIARYQRQAAAAAGRLLEAMRGWMAAGVPVSTDPDRPPPPWTKADEDATWEVAKAWRGYAMSRGMYDGLLRERALLYPEASEERQAAT